MNRHVRTSSGVTSVRVPVDTGSIAMDGARVRLEQY